jgi:multicomponent Na+:H+ antiporter subunit E
MRTTSMSLTLFAFWWIVVVPTGWTDLAVGAVASIVLATWAARFLWTERQADRVGRRPLRWLAFGVRHAGRMLVAATHVLRVVLDVRLPIDPVVVRQRFAFTSEAARVTYANALTITPGTLTVDLEDDAFVVHCLDPAFADEVRDGALAREIARLFEPHEPHGTAGAP